MKKALQGFVFSVQERQKQKWDERERHTHTQTHKKSFRGSLEGWEISYEKLLKRPPDVKANSIYKFIP